MEGFIYCMCVCEGGEGGGGLAEKGELIDEKSCGGAASSHACSVPPCLHDATGGQGIGDLAGAG